MCEYLVFIDSIVQPTKSIIYSHIMQLNRLRNLSFGKWDGPRRGCIDSEPCPPETIKQREGKTNMLMLDLLPAAGIRIYIIVGEETWRTELETRNRDWAIML